MKSLDSGIKVVEEIRNSMREKYGFTDSDNPFIILSSDTQDIIKIKKSAGELDYRKMPAGYTRELAKEKFTSAINKLKILQFKNLGRELYDLLIKQYY